MNFFSVHSLGMGKNMSKILKIIFPCILAVMLAGCSKGNNDSKAEFSVVTTIFPVYDWVQQVIGTNSDRIQLSLLQNRGIDLHNFQPSAGDILAIVNCDVFIYVGGHSDGWVNQVLAQKTNDKMIVVNLMEILCGTDVQAAQGNGDLDGHEESHHHHDNHKHNHPDEHLWLSLENSIAAVAHIAQVLSQIDTTQGDKYLENAIGYIQKIRVLDQGYKNLVELFPGQTLVFADQFPFYYLMNDYGIPYYSAFESCSGDAEASFETMAFLTEKINELELSVLMTTESPLENIAETLIASSDNQDIEILALNSLQSVSERNEGVSYLSLMEENLQVLRKAFQKGKAQ